MTIADDKSIGVILLDAECRIELLRGNIDTTVKPRDVEGRPSKLFGPSEHVTAMQAATQNRPVEICFRNRYGSIIRATIWRRSDGGFVGHWRRIDPAWARLTPREQEVARAVAETGDLQAAASELGMKYNTLVTHRKAIAAKARLDSIGDFVSWCRQNAVGIPVME